VLIPKQRIHSNGDPTNLIFTTKYCVWDTEKNDYIINVTFAFYDTQEECQEAIDWFNSLAVIKVS
jgi:hypothetical protein